MTLGDDVTLLACRDAVRPTHPALAKAWDELAPLEPGWRNAYCRGCGLAVHVGKRQHEDWRNNKGKRIIVCFHCAIEISRQGRGTVVRHLGGP